MEFADKFWTMISDAGSVVITSHRSPDDDSIASVLAMYQLIVNKFSGKRVEMIYTGLPEDGRYESFANFEKVRFVDDLANHLGEASVLVMVDGGQWDRFSNDPEKLGRFPGKTVCIDHHGSVPDRFDLVYIDKSAASCAGLIYRLFSGEGKIDQSLSRIYLLGILGDSGDLRYLRPDQMETMEIGRKLLTVLGKSIQDFAAEYALISQRIFGLVGELMKNTKYYPAVGDWPARQEAYLDREYAEAEKYSDAEISQAANLYMNNYLRWVSGYTWGVVMTPRSGGKFSVSLRSLTGSVNVRRVVERMGIGGGHDRAAGGTYEPRSGVDADLTEVRREFAVWLNSNVREE